MPDGGLNELRRIKLAKPNLPVLMFAVVDTPNTIAKAIAFGASGYLLKGCNREELLTAIRTVSAGGNLWTDARLKRELDASRGEMAMQLSRGL